jgi:Tol biopolymer transport system component
MKEENKVWTKPTLFPYSTKYHDFDMGFSTKGDKLFFCSTRPLPDSSIPNNGYDIWYVQREGNGWSNPIHIDGPINNGDKQYYPTLSSDNTLYFSTQRVNTLGERDIYKATLKNGKYDKIENLGPNVNTKYDEGDAFIAHDESYIIVCGMGRPDCLGSGDLYISFRKNDGSWTKYKHMGNEINSIYSDYCPYVSPDGKYFFFTSRRTGSDDIYWMDSKFIDELKPDELK